MLVGGRGFCWVLDDDDEGAFINIYFSYSISHKSIINS